MDQSQEFPRQIPPVDRLPKECLSKIFSYISMPELDESVAKVSQSWARVAEDEFLRTSLEITLDGEDPNSYKTLKKYLVNNKNLKHIKIWRKNEILDNNWFPKTTTQIQEFDFSLDCFHRIIASLKKLRTLSIQKVSITEFAKDWLGPLLEHPRLNTITLSNRAQYIHNEEYVLCVKFVTTHKMLDLFIETIPGDWFSFVNFVIIPLLQFSSSIKVLGPSCALKKVKSNSFAISILNFLRLCHRLGKVEKFAVNIIGCISLADFSCVTRLQNLKFLSILMKYAFSRRDLIRVFEHSDFCQLQVEIVELDSRGEPENVSLKNGSIEILFSKFEGQNHEPF